MPKQRRQRCMKEEEYTCHTISVVLTDCEMYKHRIMSSISIRFADNFIKQIFTTINFCFYKLD